MVLRPVDENGDMLPVLSPDCLLKGTDAVARLVKDRLELLAGDWWEDPEQGNEILELLRESRLAETDGQALSACLSSYIRETPGVDEVRDAAFSAHEKQFRFSCTVQAGSGTAEVEYEW